MCEISIATAAAKRGQSLRWFGAELAATPDLQGFMLKRLGRPKGSGSKSRKLAIFGKIKPLRQARQ